MFCAAEVLAVLKSMPAVRYVLMRFDKEVCAPGVEKEHIMELEELLRTTLPEDVFVAVMCSNDPDIEEHWPAAWQTGFNWAIKNMDYLDA